MKNPVNVDRLIQAVLEIAALHCEARAAYFDRTTGHYSREDAARSYRATAKEIRGLRFDRSTRNTLKQEG